MPAVKKQVQMKTKGFFQDKKQTFPASQVPVQQKKVCFSFFEKKTCILSEVDIEYKQIFENKCLQHPFDVFGEGSVLSLIHI